MSKLNDHNIQILANHSHSYKKRNFFLIARNSFIIKYLATKYVLAGETRYGHTSFASV